MGDDTTKPIKLYTYDPQWAQDFETERRKIQAVIGSCVAAIEHIGSTAVPGIRSKPLIDLMVGLHQLDDAPQTYDALERLGYVYVQHYEEIIPERRFFYKDRGKIRTHNLHMVEQGSQFWEEHLLFRDYLRDHPETAREYEALKFALAAEHQTDRPAYSGAKGEFVAAVLKRARATER